MSFLAACDQATGSIHKNVSMICDDDNDEIKCQFLSPRVVFMIPATFKYIHLFSENVLDLFVDLARERN